MDDLETGKATAGVEAERPRQDKPDCALTVKDMVLAALEAAGGVGYLKAQAQTHPTVFLTLVGKVLPLQAKDDGEATLIGRVVFKGLND